MNLQAVACYMEQDVANWIIILHLFIEMTADYCIRGIWACQLLCVGSISEKLRLHPQQGVLRGVTAACQHPRQ